MTEIAMQPVKSSNIASVGHDAPSSTLRVKFTTGAIYDYANVSAQLFTELLSAPSVGSFFATNIKKAPAEHPFQKVS